MQLPSTTHPTPSTERLPWGSTEHPGTAVQGALGSVSPWWNARLQASSPSCPSPFRAAECVWLPCHSSLAHSATPGLLLECVHVCGPQASALRSPGMILLMGPGPNLKSSSLPWWAPAPCPRRTSSLRASHPFPAYQGHLCMPHLALPGPLFLVSPAWWLMHGRLSAGV